MFYMNGRDGLDCAALQSFREIASTPPINDVRILVELARPLDPTPCPGESAPPWGGMLRFEIRSGTTATAIGRQLVQVDMGSRRTLDEFLAWALATAPAEHYMVIVWGHGTGPAFQNVNLTLDGVRSRCSESDSSRSVKAVSSDQQFGSILYNRDVENALRVFSTKIHRKIDILGFDACLMATIETAYALKDVAELMIASEELVPDCSWDYSYALRTLIEKRGRLDPDRFGRLFIDGYAAKYRENPSMYVQDPTLSILKLKYTHRVAQTLSDLAQDLEAALKGASKDSIIASRNISHYYGGSSGSHNLIDVVGFLTALQSKQDVPQSVVRRARELESTISAVVYQYAHDPKTSRGISIYFPQNGDRYRNDTLDREAYDLKGCVDRDRAHAVDFVCETAWPGFLHSYIDSVDQNSMSTASVGTSEDK